MLQIVGGRLVDSSGAPVISISALEDSSDGWIAIESGEVPPQTNDSAGVEALQNNDDSVGASDGNNVDITGADTTHDLSTSMRFAYASETSGVSTASPADSDDTSEQDQSESQSTS